MSAESRFPNRKKPVREPSLPGFNIPEPEPETPRDDITGAKPSEPIVEKTEGEAWHQSGYRIIGPAPEGSGPIFSAPKPLPPIRAIAAAKKKVAPAKPPFSKSPFAVAGMERIRKFDENSTKVYLTAGVGIGILLGVIIAVTVWRSDNPEGRYDLGSAASGADGLKGHLFIQWHKKLAYRLTIEPSDVEQQAGFALAVATSPRPLSIQINLQDSHGFILCGKEIVLKFAIRNPAALDASNPDSSTAVAAFCRDRGQRRESCWKALKAPPSRCRPPRC